MQSAFDSLKNYLSGFVSVPPTEWLYFASKLLLKKIAKDELYIRQGEEVSEIAFVVKGLFYNYFTNDKGDDFVTYFVAEGSLVACYSSLLRKAPSIFSSRAVEDSVLVTLQYEDLQKLYKRHPCWERMGRICAERLYLEKEMRERDFLVHGAKSRYENFVQENPKLIARLPQYVVAAYLGVSPVSLSRIRAGKQ